MPKQPRRPCGFPGCPNLTDGRFCEEHAKQENRRYERYQRDPATKRRYGRAWQLIRDRYAAAHPFCEECYKRGVLTPTEEIHHIVPLSHGGTHAEDNLMALCKPCHSRITVEMGDRWPQNKEYTY
ncbi:HNH endonuclease [bacterium 1xD42-67]|nr:HNH endonuclease [bacterium 1xD42-67]